ncbi:50S ribosomal protein L24 [bacterium]|jgi:large subunit ribosomal protein L24|nr:50S ribosomal protein L24 [bacterium]
MANKLKKDDEVVVLSGKDKGKTGKILKVIPAQKKVVVEGLNIIKKHKKATQDADGGIIEETYPIDWSKVQLICPATKKPTRVGFVVVDGKKKRKAKVSGEVF